MTFILTVHAISSLFSFSIVCFTQIPMLDPFVPLSVACLRLSPSATVHALAIRCAMHLIRITALPALRTHVQDIGQFLFRSIQVCDTGWDGWIVGVGASDGDGMGWMNGVK
jgi:hypothetical protein